MEEEQRDLFISYQWNIKDQVKLMHNFLEFNNYMVFRDEDTFDASNSFSSQIAKSIKNSDLFICCITETYNESANCLREINLTIYTYKKTAIVLMFEDVDLAQLEHVNLYISRLLRINLFEEPSVVESWSGPKAKEFLNAIHKALDSKAENHEPELTLNSTEKSPIEQAHILAIISDNTQLKVIDADTKWCIHTLDNRIPIGTFKFLNNNLLATICQRKTVKIWNLLAGKCIFNVTASYENINDVALVDDCTLASACSDYIIKLWSITFMQNKFTLGFSKSSSYGVSALASISDQMFWRVTTARAELKFGI